MATRILGLDIHEELLSAVVVEQRGTERIILTCASLKVDGVDQISVLLPEFLQQVGLHAGSCVLGLPLSVISLRNLTLPFTDRRKMSQVLPLELEEQMLRPMKDQVLDYMITGRQESGSHLLVGAVEKDYLGNILPVLEENGLIPQAVTPSISSLALEYLQGKGNNDPTLFLHADTHAISMALWVDGRVIFMRRVAYPDQVFAQSFTGHSQGLAILDQETEKNSISRVCDSIKASLYYFQQETVGWVQAKNAVLSGCIAGQDWWHELIAHALGLEVVASLPLQEKTGVRLSRAGQEQWKPYLFDSALALALTGLKKKKKSTGLNFLQGEFSPDPHQLFSKRSLLAAAAALALMCTGVFGFLWTDYRALSSRSSSLRGEMEAIFKQTFPGVTRVVDPLVQMQSKLKEVQGSEVSIPLFSGEKRVLEVLADISGRIPEDLSLHVSRLVIDQEAVQVQGTTDAYNNVDVIKNKLAVSPRYAEVKIVSATADKEKGSIRFEIRLQLVETS